MERDTIFLCVNLYEVEHCRFSELFQMVSNIVHRQVGREQTLSTFVMTNTDNNEFFMEYCHEYYDNFELVPDLEEYVNNNQGKKFVLIFIANSVNEYLNYLKSHGYETIANSCEVDLLIMKPLKK